MTKNRLKTPPDERILTPKQEIFTLEYLVDMNATQSAIRAGYSRKTASSQGERLLRNVEVQSRIGELKRKKAEKLDISENRILAEIASIAFSNIAELEAEHGGFAGLKTLNPATRRAIQSVKFKRYLERTTEGGFEEVEIIEIKMHPKLPALEKICEIKGIIAPPVQQRPVEVIINVTGNADVCARD